MASIHLRNNTIVLYKRPRSLKWQAELRYPADGSIHRISARTEDEHEAAAFAIKHYGPAGQLSLHISPNCAMSLSTGEKD